MNFWKDKELALRLNEGRVSEKEKLFYVLGLLIFFGIFSMINSYFASINVEKHSSEDFFVNLIYYVLYIIGTIICYQTNMKGDGINFVERISSLSFPVNIKTTLFAAILLICISIFLVIYLSTNYMSTDNTIVENFNAKYVIFIFGIIITIYYYYTLNNAMKIASKIAK